MLTSCPVQECLGGWEAVRIRAGNPLLFDPGVLEYARASGLADLSRVFLWNGHPVGAAVLTLVRLPDRTLGSLGFAELPVPLCLAEDRTVHLQIAGAVERTLREAAVDFVAFRSARPRVSGQLWDLWSAGYWAFRQEDAEFPCGPMTTMLARLNRTKRREVRRASGFALRVVEGGDGALELLRKAKIASVGRDLWSSAAWAVRARWLRDGQARIFVGLWDGQEIGFELVFVAESVARMMVGWLSPAASAADLGPSLFLLTAERLGALGIRRLYCGPVQERWALDDVGEPAHLGISRFWLALGCERVPAERLEKAFTRRGLGVVRERLQSLEEMLCPEKTESTKS